MKFFWLLLVIAIVARIVICNQSIYFSLYRYMINLRYKCPQNSVPPPLCTVGGLDYNVGNNTNFTITNLRPYFKYEINVTVYNSAGSVSSPQISETTLAEGKTL